jgi:hypothetical protein
MLNSKNNDSANFVSKYDFFIDIISIRNIFSNNRVILFTLSIPAPYQVRAIDCRYCFGTGQGIDKVLTKSGRKTIEESD